MKKRLLAGLVAGIMIAASLAGCGNTSAGSAEDGADVASGESVSDRGNESADGAENSDGANGTGNVDDAGAADGTGSTENGEIVDLEVWTTNTGFLPVEKDSESYNFYKDLMGVGIIQPYVEWNGGETYQQQLNLKIASGEMPDIFSPVNGMEASLAQSGALLDLTDLLPEKAPKLWNAVPEEVWDIMKSYDPSGEGRIYFVPSVVDYTLTGGMIRQDWLDNLGLDMPATQEQFVEVLEAFKTQDPNGNGIADEIPTGGRQEARWMDHLFAMYGIAMNEGYPQWDMYEDELTYSAVTTNMRDALEFISDLYARGLLDAETLLNDKAAWDGKVASDQVGIFFQWAEQAYLYGEMSAEATGVLPDWTIMPAISAPGYEAYYTTQKIKGIELVAANTDDEAVIDAVLKVFNAYGDEELFLDFYLGVDNMHSESVDGKQVKLADDKSKQENIVFEPFNNLASIDFKLSLMEDMKTDDRAWALDQGIRNLQEVQQYGKVIAGDGIPSKVYDEYPDILNRTLYVEYASKIIMGEYSIDKFDEFVEKWYATGGEQVTAAAREWYADVQSVK